MVENNMGPDKTLRAAEEYKKFANKLTKRIMEGEYLRDTPNRFLKINGLIFNFSIDKIEEEIDTVLTDKEKAILFKLYKKYWNEIRSDYFVGVL